MRKLTLITLLVILFTRTSFACEDSEYIKATNDIKLSANEHTAVFKAYNYDKQLLTLQTQCGQYVTFKVSLKTDKVKDVMMSDFIVKFKDSSESKLSRVTGYVYDGEKDETITVLIMKY